MTAWLRATHWFGVGAVLFQPIGGKAARLFVGQSHGTSVPSGAEAPVPKAFAIGENFVNNTVPWIGTMIGGK